MDRKMSSTSSKLRNLKEFLSSTRSLSTQNQSQNFTSQSLASSSKCPSDNASKTRKTKNSISLFNLMSTSSVSDCPLPNTNRSERPVSMALTAAMEPYAYNGFNHCDNESNIMMVPSKSVSMYGISSECKISNPIQTNTSRNPAVRLFYTIRSKFRKKRRDRSKVVDSKSTDFGSFLCDEMKAAAMSLEISNDESSKSARYKLQSSRSVDNGLDNITFFGARSDDDKRISNLQINEPIEFSSPRFEPYALNYEAPFCTTDKDSINRHELKMTSSKPKESQPKIQKCLTKELGDLLHYGWYWGGLSKDEAEEKLKGEPNGAFVVRDSSSDHYLLSLSFNSNGRTLHTRIEYRNGHFCFYSSDSDCFPSVAELIEHSIAYSEVGIFCYSKARRSDCPSYPVRLTKPISRFTEVKSLLYLSRFVIRQYVRLDLIPLLPLPSSLIDFVAEQRYI